MNTTQQTGNWATLGAPRIRRRPLMDADFLRAELRHELPARVRQWIGARLREIEQSHREQTCQ